MASNLQIHDRVDENKDYQELTDVKTTEKYIYIMMNSNERQLDAEEDILIL